jgi:hypothetical protein
MIKDASMTGMSFLSSAFPTILSNEKTSKRGFMVFPILVVVCFSRRILGRFSVFHPISARGSAYSRAKSTCPVRTHHVS